MIINRHNYEEHFLMYVDNELCASDRASVEDFVEQNGDLAGELHMLQQATLTTEEALIFEGKEGLKKDGHDISLDNYEEFFLMDVDNELSAIQKNEVERFVLQHPRLQNDYMALQQTRLEAEPIVFARKDILYRTEERRIVSLYWMKIAVAAIFIGLALFLYIVIPAKHNTGTAKDYANKNQPSQIVTPAASPEPKIITKDPPVAQKLTTSHQDNPIKSSDTKNLAVNVKPANNTKRTKPNEVATNIKLNKIDRAPEGNNLPRPVLIDHKKESDADELAVVKPHSLPGNNNIIKQALSLNENDNVVKQAVYKELDTRNEEDQNSILFGSTQINKNKLRGLLKKATRLFDKNGEKNESEKTLQIASFELR